jgi:hypothetical protein
MATQSSLSESVNRPVAPRDTVVVMCLWVTVNLSHW